MINAVQAKAIADAAKHQEFQGIMAYIEDRALLGEYETEIDLGGRLLSRYDAINMLEDLGFVVTPTNSCVTYTVSWR